MWIVRYKNKKSKKWNVFSSYDSYTEADKATSKAEKSFPKYEWNIFDPNSWGEHV